jgi:hypothetical protein
MSEIMEMAKKATNAMMAENRPRSDFVNGTFP